MSSNWVELLENFSAAALKRRGQKYKCFYVMTRAEQKQVVMLRHALLKEESKEADAAFLDVYDDLDNEEFREHLTKELCDVIYVAIGAAVDLGLDLELAFQRVHENNMLKIANCTVREDGKLVKSPDHPQVELGDCI
jgi:predicted HAD superfamily Cof-like phosphohydrolase